MRRKDFPGLSQWALNLMQVPSEKDAEGKVQFTRSWTKKLQGCCEEGTRGHLEKNSRNIVKATDQNLWRVWSCEWRFVLWLRRTNFRFLTSRTSVNNGAVWGHQATIHWLYAWTLDSWSWLVRSQEIMWAGQPVCVFCSLETKLQLFMKFSKILRPLPAIFPRYIFFIRKGKESEKAIIKKSENTETPTVLRSRCGLW